MVHTAARDPSIERSPEAVPEPIRRALRGNSMNLRSLFKTVADTAVVRPAAYLVRRLGFRQDVITRVQLMAADDSARYVMDTMMPCAIFNDRWPLLDLSLRQAAAQTGLLVEFGVFNGRSINHIAKKIGGLKVFGFDSFEGLAEDWGGMSALKGRFTRGGKLPAVAPNVTLVKGWFNETVPRFLAENPGRIAFAHLDADTYESTKYVLEQIVSRFTVGTVLQFDEYLGYPGWRHGEHLAFADLCKQKRIKYKYLGVGWMSVAVEIVEIG
jgi:hypothetical protein